MDRNFDSVRCVPVSAVAKEYSSCKGAVVFAINNLRIHLCVKEMPHKRDERPLLDFFFIFLGSYISKNYVKEKR